MKKADLEFVEFDTEDVIATSGGGCTKEHYYPNFDWNGKFYYVDLNGNGQYDGTDVKIGEDAEKYMYHKDATPCYETPLPGK